MKSWPFVDIRSWILENGGTRLGSDFPETPSAAK
jgi:hypothetical protein